MHPNENKPSASSGRRGNDVLFQMNDWGKEGNVLKSLFKDSPALLCESVHRGLLQYRSEAALKTQCSSGRFALYVRLQTELWLLKHFRLTEWRKSPECFVVTSQTLLSLKEYQHPLDLDALGLVVFHSSTSSPQQK